MSKQSTPGALGAELLRENAALRERVAVLEAELIAARAARTLASPASGARGRAGIDQELLGRALAQLPAGLLIVDCAGNILLASRQTEELFGAPMPQALGEDHGRPGPRPRRFFDVEGRELLPEARPLQRMLRDGTSLIEDFVVERADGSRVHAAFKGELVRDEGGELVGAVAVLEDVTQLRAVEEALRSSEAQFRAMADAMPQLLTRTDATGLPDYCNARWSEYSGLSSEQLLGGGLVTLLHPDERQRVVERWLEADRAGGPFELRHRIRRADGAYRWHISRSLPQRDSQGRVVRWLGTATDIDSQVRAEAELAAALDRETEARQAAERAVSFAELFVGVLGHDLRTPLSAMLMGADSLLQGSVEPDQRRSLVRLVRAGERMNRMITQLLDFTRLRLGDPLRLERQRRVDAAELWQAAIEEARAAHPGACIALEVTGDCGGSFDPDRLAQVFANLVGNAAQHGTEGAPIAVRVDGSDRAALTCSLHNQGAIAPDLLSSLFDPFRARPRRGRRDGLGLGLYISAKIVEAHGGRLDLRSEDGSTTVTVRLPR